MSRKKFVPIKNSSSREGFLTSLTDPPFSVTVNLFKVTFVRVLIVKELLTPNIVNSCEKIENVMKEKKIEFV